MKLLPFLRVIFIVIGIYLIGHKSEYGFRYKGADNWPTSYIRLEVRLVFVRESKTNCLFTPVCTLLQKKNKFLNAIYGWKSSVHLSTRATGQPILFIYAKFYFGT